MKKTKTDAIILRYSDSQGVIHDIGLNSILDGGFPIDDESGEEMEFLESFVLEDN